MNPAPVTVSTARTDVAVHMLARLAEDLVAALQPQRTVRLDLSDCGEADIRIVQLVEAARRHATGVGAQLILAGPSGFDAGRLLARAGMTDSAENRFWFQGDIQQ